MTNFKHFSSLIGALSIFLALATSATTFGSTGFNHAGDPLDLEVLAWTAEDSDLARIERLVVRSLQMQPRSPLNHYLMAHVLVRMFSTDPSQLQLLRQASELAQQAVDIEPFADYGYVALADILDLMGHTQKAETLLRDAENAGVRTTWRFDFTKARLLANPSDVPKVLNLLRRAMEDKESKRAIIAPYIVAVLQAEENPENLLKSLASWNSRFPALTFKQTMATTMTTLGMYRDAHEVHRLIQKEWPGNKESLVNDAVIQYRHLGKVDQAISQLSKVIREHQGTIGKTSESMVHAHLAAAKLRKGDLKAANNSFVEALKTAPDLSVTLGFIAKEYGKEKSRELAGLLDLAVIEVPGESAMFALMAETLVDRLGDIKQGLDAWRNAIALEPGRSEYYSGMGLAYYKDKKWADALRLFSLAAKADPSDATAHYNLACALALLGREEESIASLQEALSLDPKLATNAKSDRDFDAIASSRAFRDLVTSMESEIQPALGESVMPAH